jgi:hypothetical protein
VFFAPSQSLSLFCFFLSLFPLNCNHFVIWFCDLCRPLNEREIEEKQTAVLICDEKSRTVSVQLKTNKNLQKTFSYDMVFGPTASQKDIYTSAIAPIGTLLLLSCRPRPRPRPLSFFFLD